MTNISPEQSKFDFGPEHQVDAGRAHSGETHWQEKAAEAASLDADPNTVAWHERAGVLYQQILHNRIRGGANLEVPGVPSSRYEQIRYWMHLHGPDNDFEGMQDDLVVAANIVTERAPEIPTSPEQTQAALVEAASTFAIAANLPDDLSERMQLLGGAQKALRSLHESTNQMSFEDREQLDKGLLARAELVKEDVTFTQLIEIHNDEHATDEVKAEVDKRFQMAHANSIVSFASMMESGALTPQMAVEWYQTIDARHQLLRAGQQYEQRVRSAYPHERKPATLHGTTDYREFDDSFTGVVEYPQDGKWVATNRGHTAVRIGGVDRQETPKPPLGSIQQVVVEVGGHDSNFFNKLSQGANALRKDMEMFNLHGEWQDVSERVTKAIEDGHELVTA